MSALSQVGFDTTRDRLFCVGDLVDRGGASLDCLALLEEPWVWSVRGNHEQMALDVFAADGSAPDDDHRLDWMSRNGMDWWLSVPPRERVPYLATLARLPFVLEVDTVRGLVGVLHADVPRGTNWPTFVARVEMLHHQTLQTCLWSRQRIEGHHHEGVQGVGRIFVGHTPQWGRLHRYGNVYAVDTGAVFGEQGQHRQGALSLTNVLTRTEATTVRRPIRLLNILDEPAQPGHLFGQGPGYTEPATWMQRLLERV